MPPYTHAFLIAVQEHLKAAHRPNDMPAAIKWANRLRRPLHQGPRVDSFTVLKGPVELPSLISERSFVFPPGYSGVMYANAGANAKARKRAWTAYDAAQVRS